MKKSIVFCMCLIAGSAMAQEETVTITAVKKGEEPGADTKAFYRKQPVFDPHRY